MAGAPALTQWDRPCAEERPQRMTTLAVDGTRFYLRWEKGVGGRS
jgi:hypothetical protein